MKTKPFDRWVAHPAWAIVAAFGAYFCMYGFRKPFTAGSYTQYQGLGIDYKTVLVTAQVLGYAFSKWIGIRVISEVRASQRAWMMLAFIGFAELMLLGFGLVPAPWNMIFLFLNGVPLGMVYGLVQGYLEGRQMTEALVAGLCASFILADGATKSVGAYLLQQGTPEYWMPFLAGLLFVLPLLLFVWMLTRIPQPSEVDVARRAKREPMQGAERRAFFWRYAPGLTGLAILFLITTLLRSMRADFAPELWAGLGFTGVPAVFTQSEFYVMLGVILVNGFGVFIVDNRRAFFTALAVSIGGFLLVIAASLGLDHGLDGFWYMVLLGLGLYLPYVAVHTTVFERLIAMTRERANMGFLMYLVDAIGYFGYCGLIIGRSWLRASEQLLPFYNQLSLWLSVAGLVAIAGTWLYFSVYQRPAEAVS